MESPLIYDDLEDGQLKAQFESLVDCMRTIPNMTEGEVIAFLERIRQEVTTTPNLARIRKNNLCLLSYALVLFDETRILDSEISAIKVLIDANPSALLWRITDDDEYPINIIPSHPTLQSLMPWIATKHQWVLDHEKIIDDPPVIELIKLFQSAIKQSRERNATTAIRRLAQTIYQFFEAYPHSLTQKDSNGLSPLHLILLLPECKGDLIKKMVELCPTSVMAKTNGGLTPLHIACLRMAKVTDITSKEICLYLISECPESVRCATLREGKYPIQYLIKHCQHQAVREVIVCLLRAYPESYDIQVRGVRGSAPSSFPFIQHVNSLLVEERALQDNIAQLKSIMGAFDNAVNCTREDLIKSTCTVFHSWVVLSIQRIESKIELNLSQLQQACDTWVS